MTNSAKSLAPFADVAFVQPDIPAMVKWDPSKTSGIIQNLRATTLAAGALHPDLILWPESTTPFPLRGGDPSMRAFVEQLSAQTKAPMLVGADAIEAGPSGRDLYYNAAFVVDPERRAPDGILRQAPPGPVWRICPAPAAPRLAGKFAPLGDDDFSAGTSSAPLVVPLDTGAAALGVLICYEDLFPQLASSEVRSGADALVVVTNDAWYGEGAAAYQHAAHSVLRAVETRRPVLRCGNAGWSGWIDEFGRVGSVLNVDEAGTCATDQGRTSETAASISMGRRWPTSPATSAGSGATASTSSTATGLSQPARAPPRLASRLLSVLKIPSAAAEKPVP